MLLVEKQVYLNMCRNINKQTFSSFGLNEPVAQSG